MEAKQRSLFTIGKNTLVMTIPSKWVDLLTLKSGDKVTIFKENNGTLTILPKNATEIMETEITADIATLNPKDFEKMIIAKYVDGYSIINIKAINGTFDNQHQDNIRKSVKKLFGMHILKINDREVMLQSLLSPSELPIRKGLERIHLLALSMYNSALNTLTTFDSSIAKSNLILRDDLVRFYYLVLRQLRSSLLSGRIIRSLKINQIDCLDYFATCQIIMRVGNYAEQILKDVIALGDFRLPEDVLNSIESFGKNAINVYLRSLNAFFESNISYSFEIMEPVQTDINLQTLNLNRKLAENKEERIPCEKMCHVIQIVANMKRVADQGIELAETNIPSNTS